MRRFSAQYVITNSGPPLKRPIITTGDDGTIMKIEDTGGNLQETHSVEFYNGLIIPGFVNCHCHLELSHMKGAAARGKGLAAFIGEVREKRSPDDESIVSAARNADCMMYEAGINLCADICNTSLSFGIKKESSINYISLIEVFGINPARAAERMAEVMKVKEEADEMDLPCYLVPHSVYSVSLPLFRLLREKTNDNKVTSVHFMEDPAEAELVENHAGALLTSYQQSGLVPAGIETASSHADAILNEVTGNGNLILVHNTFTDGNTIRKLKKRENTFWCLCPGSNMYIENTIPPVGLLMEQGCTITIGTDSLASNEKLDILGELKALQKQFPSLTLEELVAWGTVNGAEALGMEKSFGRIREGMRPGLLLLQNADLVNLKLLQDSCITRLI